MGLGRCESLHFRIVTLVLGLAFLQLPVAGDVLGRGGAHLHVGVQLLVERVGARHANKGAVGAGSAGLEIHRALDRIVGMLRLCQVLVDVQPRVGERLLVLGTAQYGTTVEARCQRHAALHSQS